jgi:hypothetical protein
VACNAKESRGERKRVRSCTHFDSELVFSHERLFSCRCRSSRLGRESVGAEAEDCRKKRREAGVEEQARLCERICGVDVVVEGRVVARGDVQSLLMATLENRYWRRRRKRKEKRRKQKQKPYHYCATGWVANREISRLASTASVRVALARVQCEAVRAHACGYIIRDDRSIMMHQTQP